ncbi:MAG: methylenetetrahydrofolate reductase [Treponemataceae bacterium]|nr:methylenetetrahydrofolate reductase [Treponemataceae bacterium]
MNISTILKQKKVAVSFEVFPPKRQDDFATVSEAAKKLVSLRPDFVSITCGAAGSQKTGTADVAELIERHGTTALAHLTCVRLTREQLDAAIADFKARGIQNVLALRGDLPKDAQPGENLFPAGLWHASDLVAVLKREGFCVGGACYPEGHPESLNRDSDIENLKHKVDAGVDFLTTQMFFDNDMLYSFLYRLQAAGIHVPVLAGLMPVTSARQVNRMVDLSNAYIPRKLLSLCDKFRGSEDAMWQAGIAYVTDQIIDLISNGVRGIHIYTMNKPRVAQAIMQNVDNILSAINGTAAS